LSLGKNGGKKKISSKNTQYIAIAVVAIIIIGAGAQWYMGEQQKQADIDAREEKWDDWTETLYVGTTSLDFHPGINIGYGTKNTLLKHMSATKPMWVDANDVGEYNPMIAQSWELKHDAEGLSYIEWKIKPGLTFNDGEPITAGDIKFSWEWEFFELPDREINQDTYHLYAHSMAWGTESKGLFAPDDSTFQMYTNPDWPDFVPAIFAFLFSLDHAFVFSETTTMDYALEDSPLDDYAIQAKQAGFGPFILDEWDPEQWITLVKNEDYPQNPLGGEAGPTKSLHIERIVATTYADAAAMRIALEKGEIDATIGGGIAMADVPDIQDNPDLTMNLIPYMGSGRQLHLNYDPEFYPLNDTRVRRAISLLIDPDEIIDKLTFGTAVRMDSPVRPMQPYYKGIFTPDRELPLADRIQMANDLLADAGFADGFTTYLWYSTTSTSDRAVGEILKDQLLAGNINLELKTMEGGVLYPLIRAGEIPMFFRGWTHDYPDPDSELFYLMHSTSPDLAMRINFNESYIDDLIVEGRALYDPAGDPPARAQVYIDIQDWYYENGFATPIYFSSMWNAQRNWVKDYTQWVTCDKPWQGLWNVRKEAPADWADYDPPI